MESSRLRDGQFGGEDPVVAQEGPQDADSSAADRGSHGPDAFGALAALFEAEGPVRPFSDFSDDAGPCGHAGHPP